MPRTKNGAGPVSAATESEARKSVGIGTHDADSSKLKLDSEQGLSFHPLANVFPLLEGPELEQLVEDIRAQGLLEPIVLLDEQILDGRNRYRACQQAGVEPTYRPFMGDDPLGFVISLNLKRRHLSESQRAMVAAKLATLKLGDNQHSEGLQIGRGSELLNVGERSVARAREVQGHGAPELIHAVERGDVAVSTAADIATLPVDEQREIVACGEREILKAAKAIRAERTAKRRAECTARTIALSNQNAPLPRGRRYPVILADPAWPFEVYDAASGMGRSPESHYPCMPIEDICALPVAELATPDAALFLWTTSPHLQTAFSVLEAWGFKYKSNIAWDKGETGTGYWARNQHELLLIATRGDMRSPPEDRRPPSVIRAPRREHSRKPDEAYEYIERMYPELPKIELFARARRPGFEAWGNEAPPTPEKQTKKRVSRPRKTQRRTYTRTPKAIKHNMRMEKLGDDYARIENTLLRKPLQISALIELKRARPEQAEALIKRAEAGEAVNAVAEIAAIKQTRARSRASKSSSTGSTPPGPAVVDESNDPGPFPPDLLRIPKAV
jgi:N6-adenosine-specific RNA methylase IME4